MKVIPLKSLREKQDPSEPVQDITLARKVALNRFCTTLVSAENQSRFRAFPDAYCRDFNLDLEQSQAVTDLDIMKLLRLGVTTPNLKLLTDVYDLDIAELCSEQTGLPLEEVSQLLAHD